MKVLVFSDHHSPFHIACLQATMPTRLLTCLPFVRRPIRTISCPSWKGVREWQSFARELLTPLALTASTSRSWHSPRHWTCLQASHTWIGLAVFQQKRFVCLCVRVCVSCMFSSPRQPSLPSPPPANTHAHKHIHRHTLTHARHAIGTQRTAECTHKPERVTFFSPSLIQQSAGENVTEHVIPDGREPVVHLLYRPGHYDIVYRA